MIFNGLVRNAHIDCSLFYIVFYTYKKLDRYNWTYQGQTCFVAQKCNIEMHFLMKCNFFFN
jgi:hypothetical protein